MKNRPNCQRIPTDVAGAGRIWCCPVKGFAIHVQQILTQRRVGSYVDYGSVVEVAAIMVRVTRGLVTPDIDAVMFVVPGETPVTKQGA